MKTCSKCGVEKELSEFKEGRFKKSHICFSCQDNYKKTYAKSYRLSGKQAIAKKKYTTSEKGVIKEKEYRQTEKRKEYRRKYCSSKSYLEYLKNYRNTPMVKEKIDEYKKSDSYRISQRKWSINNPDIVRRIAEKYKKTEKGVTNSIKGGVIQSFKRQGIPIEVVPIELIEIKVLNLKLKRRINKLTINQNETSK